MTDEDLIRTARGLAKRFSIRGLTRQDVAHELVVAGLEARKLKKPPSHVVNRMKDRLRVLVRSGLDTPVPFSDVPGKLPYHTDKDPDGFSLARHVWPHLTDRQKEIVQLAYVENLADREIGERLGISENAAKMARHKILKKLRHENEEFNVDSM